MNLGRLAAVVFGGLMASCSYVIMDPTDGTKLMAKCHENMLEAFCVVVNQPKGSMMVQGLPILQGLAGIGMDAAGAGNILAGIK